MNLKKILLSICAQFILLGFAVAQKSTLDSLKEELKKPMHDTLKFKVLYDVCHQFYISSANESGNYRKQLLQLSHAINKTYHLARAYEMNGLLWTMLNNNDSALHYLNKALAYAENGKHDMQIADIYDAYGSVYEIAGDYDVALDKHLKALNIHEKTQDKTGMANSYKYIGRIFGIQQKFTQALSYFNKSKEIDKETNNIYAYGQSINNAGICLLNLNKIDSAILCFNESIKAKTQTGNKKGLISTYSYLVDAYLKINDTRNAINTSLTLTKLAEELNNNLALAAAYEKTGEVYSAIKRPIIAKSNYVKALQNYTIAQKKEGIMNSHLNLSKEYKKLSVLDSSLYHLNEYVVLKDSLFTENNTKSISEMEAKYQNQKKELEISMLQKNKQIADYEISKQKTFRNFLLVIAILVFVTVIVLFKAYSNKKIVNKQLTQKNVEIENQKEIIEIKQKGITDSINYALRIQEALLPSKEMKQTLFPESFVLLLPKDIVSGDFYWYSEKNGKKIITAVDCTGHGVPGAFMSMIGVTFLNEIVNERGITKPSEILGELRDRVKTSLKQKGLDGESRDGMDMSIVSFNKDFTEVEYAGANNPLWIFRREKNEIKILEFAPDKRPIGYFKGQGLPFTNQTISLQKGDILYIFSDGYADQFGGPKGKKFKYKQIKEILAEINHLPMHAQEEHLLKRFIEWRGNLEQIDDVCIIGISV